MTTQLLSATAPSTRTSHAGLVEVELRRLWWRRLSKAMLVIAVLFTGATVYGAYQSTSPANLAMQIDSYQRDVKGFPEMQRQCQQAQAEARDRGEPADFGCDQMVLPTLEQYGITAPGADSLFGQLSRTNAFLYAFLGLVLGASFVGAEYSAGSLGQWLTFEPRRMRVASSKLVAAGIGGAAIALLGLALSGAGAWLVSAVNQPDPSLQIPAAAVLDDPILHVVLRCLVVAVLAAVTGAALALIARNTGAVVAVVLGYAVIVEGILASALAQGRLAPWLPVKNVEAFLGLGTTYFAEVCTATGCNYSQLTISYTHGWVYLLIAMPLLVALALVVFRRRDLA